MFAAMDDQTGGGVPQFATAEYRGPAADPCNACGQPVGGSYYQVNGQQVCPSCAEKIKASRPADSHAAFVRGLLFGIGGAALGLALYVAFALGTGLVAGIVSLAVGFIVGKAIIFGSGGVKGRRYQIAAVILTYSAVSLSAVPIWISIQTKHRQEAAQSSPAAAAEAQHAPRSLAQSIGMLALLGLASPFLDLQDPAHGLIGLIILFVGIRIAWRLTAGSNLEVAGPFDAAAPKAI